MKIVLLGAPGAGKGSQAANLVKALDVPHIATGDIFRNNINEGTELGKLAKQYIEKGALVPDEVTIGIVKDRLLKDDCMRGFLLDGFPRTIPQAEALEKILRDLKIELDGVVNLVVSDEIIVKRLSKRRVCTCGRTYHIENSPPKLEGVCDSCGGKLVIREDDKPETVRARLKTYHLQTEPLIEYYENKGLLINVDGSGDIDDITKIILDKLNRL